MKKTMKDKIIEVIENCYADDTKGITVSGIKLL